MTLVVRIAELFARSPERGGAVIPNVAFGRLGDEIRRVGDDRPGVEASVQHEAEQALRIVAEQSRRAHDHLLGDEPRVAALGQVLLFGQPEDAHGQRRAAVQYQDPGLVLEQIQQGRVDDGRAVSPRHDDRVFDRPLGSGRQAPERLREAVVRVTLLDYQRRVEPLVRPERVDDDSRLDSSGGIQL